MQLKERQGINRSLLVTELQQQYAGLPVTEAVTANLQRLLEPTTFTVCTAHQPNLFTGPLYFIYKILHTIRLAAHLREALPGYHFVPLYYMGSEDADFAELNHTYVGGKRIEWQKVQSGAVGRMTVDGALTRLIDELAGQLTVEPHGQEVIGLLRQCYTEGQTIQAATFALVNQLYGRYGLLVLIPDNPALKKEMLPVFRDDLYHQAPSAIVEQTSGNLEANYNAQAHPREINLFYLKDNLRERIIKKDDRYQVQHTDLSFSGSELEHELEQHPERFSPNVILRGLFQETILPNVAFIGGGGELAYWLQLKDLFDQYAVPFPVLVLRNSFLIIEKRWQQLMQRLRLTPEQLFLSPLQLMNLMLEQEGKKPQLNGEVRQLEALYDALQQRAVAVDASLAQHVAALKAKAGNQLLNLEKKMQRAERKKYGASEEQITRLKEQLFPNNGLQERVENFSAFYARWGSAFIDALLASSLSLEQQFTVLLADQ